MRLISSDGSHPGGLPIPRMKSSGVMSSNSPRWRLASKSPSSGTSSFITGMVPLSRTACECHVLPILPIAQSGAAVCLRGVRLYTFRKRAFAILRSIARYCFLKSAYSVSGKWGTHMATHAVTSQDFNRSSNPMIWCSWISGPRGAVRAVHSAQRSRRQARRIRTSISRRWISIRIPIGRRGQGSGSADADGRQEAADHLPAGRRVARFRFG